LSTRQKVRSAARGGERVSRRRSERRTLKWVTLWKRTKRSSTDLLPLACSSSRTSSCAGSADVSKSVDGALTKRRIVFGA